MKRSDAGRYSCTATNKYGIQKCDALLTVCEDKNIFGDKSGKILPSGVQPVFDWKRNGLPFDPEERFKVLLGDDEDSLALLFQHVKPEDAGIYTCVAQTSTGNISCSAELTVQGAVQQLLREPEKPKLTVEHREASASIGGTAMLELQYSGYPKPEIQWQHDGTTIEAGGKYKFLHEDAETMSLVIKGVQPEDSGTYSIVATNEMGSEKTSVELVVKSPPIVGKVADRTVSKGERLQIDVEVTGNPEPAVRILNNGKELVQTERVKIVRSERINSKTTYSLQVTTTELTDAGSYSVVASNDMSQTSEFWNVVVNSSPTIGKRLEKEYVHGEREEIIMSVRCDAFPLPKVRWFKDGKELSESDARIRRTVDGNAYVLSISGAVSTDAGDYRVELENEHGRVENETSVQIKCSPVFKRKLGNMTVTEGDTNVELVVQTQGYPK